MRRLRAVMRCPSSPADSSRCHGARASERGRQALVPGPRERPVQFIAARDLATFLLDLLETDRSGGYIACSNADQWTMRDVVDALRSIPGPMPEPVWVDEAALLAHGVQPWVELPLWIPANDPDSRGFMEFDCRRAAHAGLVPRPLTTTIAETAPWLAKRDNAGARQHVHDGEKER